MQTPQTDPLHLETLADVLTQVHLDIVVTDVNLVIEQTTARAGAYPVRKWVGHPLLQVIPLLGALEEELDRIVKGEAEPWRVLGLQLFESFPHHFDVVFMPRKAAPGLLLAFRRVEPEFAFEQVVRQQRNELSLLRDKLESQAAILRQAKDRVQNLDRERQALLNLITHDLKSALSVVSGHAELLRIQMHDSDQQKQQMSLAAILQDVERMNALVENAMAIERAEEALTTMQWEPVDLANLARSVTVMWRSVAQRRGILLHERIAEDRPLEVMGSKTLLEEAIRDLLESAIHRTVTGAQLVLEVRAHNHWVIVTARHLDSEPQRRRERRGRAESLDFALARLIADGHGGHLSGESQGDQGVIASLWLLAKGREGDLPAFSQHTDQEQTPAALSIPGPKTMGEVYSNLVVVGEGHIRIHTVSHQVWVDDKPVSLSSGEYRLLVHFAENTGRVVTYDHAMDVIWPLGGDVSTESVRMLVWRLRQKIQPSTSRPPLLQTVRGFGYMLVP